MESDWGTNLIVTSVLHIPTNTYVVHTHDQYTVNRKGIVLKLKVIRNLWECLEMSMTTEERVLDGPSWSRDRNLDSTANSECLVLYRIFCPEPSFWTLGVLELLVCQCISLLEKLWTLEAFWKTHGHQHISSNLSLLQLINYVSFSFLVRWRKGKVDYLVIRPVDAVTMNLNIYLKMTFFLM